MRDMRLRYPVRMSAQVLRTLSLGRFLQHGQIIDKSTIPTKCSEISQAPHLAQHAGRNSPLQLFSRMTSLTPRLGISFNLPGRPRRTDDRYVATARHSQTLGVADRISTQETSHSSRCAPRHADQRSHYRNSRRAPMH